MESYQLLQRARLAASQMFDDVDSVRFIDTSPAGEKRFAVTRKNIKDIVTVTINPNGLAAGVEWKKGREGKPGYRIFRLQGLVQDDQSAA